MWSSAARGAGDWTEMAQFVPRVVGETEGGMPATPQAANPEQGCGDPACSARGHLLVQSLLPPACCWLHPCFAPRLHVAHTSGSDASVLLSLHPGFSSVMT